MNEPIDQLNTTFHQMFQNRVPVGSLTDPQVGNKTASHRYTIENNLIIYEKYDRHGKLILKVPWSQKTIA